MRTWSLTLLLPLAMACDRRETAARVDSTNHTGARVDSQFAQLQRRGATVMGVDQYSSRHVFEDLPNGGRIVLERDDRSDTTAINTIRAHMHEIATDFRQGNFAAPGLVHAQKVPGTDVMRDRRAFIAYVATDRPRGAEVRILSADSASIAAVHRFLAFQRMDHRAAGHVSH